MFRQRSGEQTFNIQNVRQFPQHLSDKALTQVYHARLITPSRRAAAKNARRTGTTQLWCENHPKTGVFKLRAVIFDSNIRNAESLRRMKKMAQAAEAHAKNLGALWAETDYTIINPKLASRLGYAKIGKAGPFYKYSKSLLDDARFREIIGGFNERSRVAKGADFNPRDELPAKVRPVAEMPKAMPRALARGRSPESARPQGRKKSARTIH